MIVIYCVIFNGTVLLKFEKKYFMLKYVTFIKQLLKIFSVDLYKVLFVCFYRFFSAVMDVVTKTGKLHKMITNTCILQIILMLYLIVIIIFYILIISFYPLKLIMNVFPQNSLDEDKGI